MYINIYKYTIGIKKHEMIESNHQSIYDLPYRARIMMTANIDNQKPVFNNPKLNSFSNHLQNLKPMNNLKSNSVNSKSSGSSLLGYSSGDLQPLQWLQHDTILSIAPLDNEEEFVPGREDITSVSTSPVKVDVVAEQRSMDQEEAAAAAAGGITGTTVQQSSTIADYYRYQAMRAAMAGAAHGTLAGGAGGGGGSGTGGHAIAAPTGAGSYRSSFVGCQRPLCHPAPPPTMPGAGVGEFQKPPFSYTHIIFMAIETSPNKAMTVNDIYVWCETHFPYYTHAGVGWKNSLRHNLSINKSFKKISRDGRGGPGRGAYWVVEPRERNNLIDAIRRSPCSLGSFPFLSNAYPWGAGNCYSNSIFQSTNTLNSNLASLTATRSVVNNKLNSTADLQSSSRGPLLRIGGQITDASNLIRSTPVIQRLNDSCNIIELPKSSQIISNTFTLSTVPLIQFDQIKFEADVTTLNESTDSNDLFSAQFDEEECRGKVFVIDDTAETDPEFYQTYLDIIRGLVYNDTEKSNSSRSESNKDCPENSKYKKQTNHKNSNSKSGAVIEDLLPPEVSESDESGSSVSNKEFSELSDTDFNWRISMGLKNQHKEKKKMYYSKLKSLSNNRKSNHTRNRVTNIIRAPHSDHVYALLQEFLVPVNVSECMSPHNQNLDDKESFSSTVAEDKSLSLDLSQTSLSKRSKHKLQFQIKSKKKYLCSNSDAEYFSPMKFENFSKKLIRNSLSYSSKKRKSNKSILSSKLKNNSRLLKENSEYINKKIYRKYNYDDVDEDEERENRYYDKNESSDEILFSGNIYDAIKFEDLENSLRTAMEDGVDNKSNTFDPNLFAFKRMRLNKDSNIKRKVGRPKKSEYNSNTCRNSNDYRIQKEKIMINKFKRKIKSSKRDLKYLKECNSNRKINSEISNKDEQVAINILANLQRKNQQERIKNMYNLSNFIDRSNSDSNMS